MSQASENLPKFKNPPVVEVALGAQFQQFSGINVAHLGLIWERFKSELPDIQQLPPLPHTIERKGIHQQSIMPQISLMGPADQVPRLWMISQDNTELAQVQSDRFTRNWRKYHDAGLAYPSYDSHCRSAFVKDFDVFCDFALAQGWGAPRFDQCEVAYINHIFPCDVWKEFSQLDRVFKGLGSVRPALPAGAPNMVAFRARHEVSDEQGKFVGHLFLELDSAFSMPAVDGKGEFLPLLQFQLLVRGRPLGEGTAGVMRFMDFAHSIIVKSFAEITTPEMHSVWERI